MCTLTWRARKNATGYELWFNRDELRGREAEAPPREWTAGAAGTRFLAPVDGARGGTWLAVNEHGLTVALLNDYAATWRPATPTRSRGDVVMKAAGAARIGDVAAGLTAETLRTTGAFTLVALEVEGGRGAWHWDGVRVAEILGEDMPEFFSSSSYCTTAVIAARRAEFERSEAAGGGREAYHLFYDKTRGAESVLMNRPDACTRSVCAVRAGEATVELEYAPVEWGAGGAAMTKRGLFLLERAKKRGAA